MPQPEGSPSFRVIEAALRRTTEYLALHLAAFGDTPPDWNDAEWRIAKAVLAMQGMTVQVAAARRWKGPDHWEAFLLEQRRILCCGIETFASVWRWWMQVRATRAFLSSP